MDINLITPINNLGYGIHGFNMLKSLIDNDVNISLSIVGTPNINETTQEYIMQCKAGINPDNYTLHIFHDDGLPVKENNKLIAFSVFETTKLKPETVEKLNQTEFIFTTTEDHKNILKSNEVTKDIYVIHEGVDPELFNNEDSEKLIDTGKYTFMLVGKNEKRKNTSLAMSAFLESMQYENVALICNTYSPFIKDSQKIKNWYETDITLLGYKVIKETELYVHFSNSFSDIYYTKPILTNEQMKSLYHSANVGISFSSAEGWGLPEMELMACGIPTIITNVIGHRAYISNLPIFRDLIINPKEIEVANDGRFFHGDVGIWAKFHSNELQEKLKYVYTNNIGNTRSQELSDYIINNFNWDLSAKEVKQIIERVQNEN